MKNDIYKTFCQQFFLLITLIFLKCQNQVNFFLTYEAAFCNWHQIQGVPFEIFAFKNDCFTETVHFWCLVLKAKICLNGDRQFEPLKLIENCNIYCPFLNKFTISNSPQTHFGFTNIGTFLFKNKDISFQLFMWNTLYLIYVEINLKLALFGSAIDIFDQRISLFITCFTLVTFRFVDWKDD